MRTFDLLFLSFMILLSGCKELLDAPKYLFYQKKDQRPITERARVVEDLKGGKDFMCALMGDQTLRCFGNQSEGQLGVAYSLSGQPFEKIEAVRAGDGFTCFIHGTEKKVSCIGRNDVGQTEAHTEDGKPLLGIESIERSHQSVCALKKGQLWCWGGRFGKHAIRLEGEEVSSFALNQDSLCVVRGKDQELVCQGLRMGSINGEVSNRWIPIEGEKGMGPMVKVQQVVLGKSFGCLLLTNSEVYCFGESYEGNLGNGQLFFRSRFAVPVIVSFPEPHTLSKVERISAGDEHVCALERIDRSIFCWGKNQFGQLGNTSRRLYPEQVSLGKNNLTLKSAKEIFTGLDRSCLLSARDELFCFGRGDKGLLGSEKGSSPYPVLISQIQEPVKEVSIGASHACALLISGKLFCFGTNEYEQMGKDQVASPVLGDEGWIAKKIQSFDLARHHWCMIYEEDQTVACGGSIRFPAKAFEGTTGVYTKTQGLAVTEDRLCLITPESKVLCHDLFAKQPPNYLKTPNGMIAENVWHIRAGEKDEFCALEHIEGKGFCQNIGGQSVELTDGKNALSSLLQISVSQEQVCAVRSIGRVVYCTADPKKPNQRHLLSVVFTDQGKPLQNIVDLKSSKWGHCARDTQGEVWCWGAAFSKQKGIARSYFKNVNAMGVMEQGVCGWAAGESELRCKRMKDPVGTRSETLVTYSL